MNKRAQGGMESLIVIGVILMLTVPVLGQTLYTVSKNVKRETDASIATTLAETIKTVANLGPGNTFTIYSKEPITIEDNIAYIGGTAIDPHAVAIPIIPTVSDSTVSSGVINVYNIGTGISIQNLPLISSLNPTSATEGQRIAVYGQHFTPTSLLVVDGNTYPDTGYVSAEELGFNTQELGIGAHTLYVYEPLGSYGVDSNVVSFILT